MKGSNKIVLNQQEMCIAMQQYVDAQFKASPGKVSRVSTDKDTDRNSYSNGSDGFTVVIEEPKEGAAAA